jgi:hypothetical protein
MKRARHTEEKIVVVLQEGQAGADMEDFCRRHGINHKRTERFYREEGLSLHRKRRRKLPTVARMPIPSP